MNTYTVRINVEKSFEFDDEIEAADEVDAEEIAKGRLWRGDYQKEERACAEITDETYNAEEVEEIVQCEICCARYSNLKDEDERGYTLVEAFEESEQVIYQPQEISMSYMGEYVMWCMENGIPLGAPMRAEDVARYHKENPHMIPKPRDEEEDAKETQ